MHGARSRVHKPPARVCARCCRCRCPPSSSWTPRSRSLTAPSSRCDLQASRTQWHGPCRALVAPNLAWVPPLAHTACAHKFPRTCALAAQDTVVVTHSGAAVVARPGARSLAPDALDSLRGRASHIPDQPHAPTPSSSGVGATTKLISRSCVRKLQPAPHAPSSCGRRRPRAAGRGQGRGGSPAAAGI
jgi:hypothetical protein